MRREQFDCRGARGARDRTEQQCQPAAAAEKAAQQSEAFLLGIFGDEALRGRAQSEIDHAADQKDPSPAINVNAELEAPHPARQQNLRHEGERRADHPDEKGGAGEPPHQRGIAAVGKQRVHALDGVADMRAEGYRIEDARMHVQGFAPIATRRGLGTD